MKTAFVTLLFATVAWARHFQPLHSAKLEKQGNVGTDIVNGQDAYPGQFPYMAALVLRFTEFYRCGAVLITMDWVLTTCQCSGESGLLYDVYLGVTDFNDRDVGQPTRPGFIDIYRYPSYDWGPQNDLALFRLANIVGEGPYITPVDIAPDNEDDYVGASCVTMGWGEKFAGDPTEPGVLQYIETNVISNSECKERTGYDVTTNICAYTGSSGPCIGDKGGPLVCTRNGASYVVGVLHKVDDLCYPTVPSVFTRISLYNTWIHSIINSDQ